MKDLLQSPKIRPILWGLGALIILLLVFSLGTAVGYRRGIFASRWGENYYQNFYGGPPGGGLPGAMVQSMLGGGPGGIATRAPFNMHGVAGEVLDVATATISVRDPVGDEESVAVFPDTVIRGMDDMMQLGEVKAGEWITVIGAPTDSGQIGARFIRVFISSSSLPVDGN
jgi:hypothetical protein